MSNRQPVTAANVVNKIVKESVDRMLDDLNGYVALYKFDPDPRITDPEMEWARIALFADDAPAPGQSALREFLNKVKSLSYNSFSVDECLRAQHNCGYVLMLVAA